VAKRVATLDLQGVAQGVAKVQLAPLAGLERVTVHDVQLYSHCPFGHRVRRRRIGALNRADAACLDELPEQRICDQACLQTLRDPVATLVNRK
jgi:hypothetical protein